jgi:hypothetical protein
MKNWLKFAALASAFALTILLTSYVSRLPESNCATEPVSTLWTNDRAYKATLLKKDCNRSEPIFYSVRIDRPGDWFLRVEIEEDPYPAQALEPAMKWDSHKLEIEIPAETFTGSIERHEGALTIVRTYSRKPQ